MGYSFCTSNIAPVAGEIFTASLIAGKNSSCYILLDSIFQGFYLAYENFFHPRFETIFLDVIVELFLVCIGEFYSIAAENGLINFPFVASRVVRTYYDTFERSFRSHWNVARGRIKAFATYPLTLLSKSSLDWSFLTFLHSTWEFCKHPLLFALPPEYRARSCFSIYIFLAGNSDKVYLIDRCNHFLVRISLNLIMYKIIEESNDLLLTHIRDESSFFFFFLSLFLSCEKS